MPRRRLLDRTYDITLVAKGLDGVLELFGGILLLLVSPATLNSLAVHLTQHELTRDPHDFIATHLLHAANNLHDTQTFGATYLLAHGATKIVLVVALLKNQRWAYPATLAVLAVFIAYQLYRMAYDPTIGLAFLTAFDAFIVWLVWREYQLHQTHETTTR